MDLHSGLPYWIVKNELYNYYNPLPHNYSTTVAIIGSGITGALVAHELCEAGIECTVFDKRTLATGSTAASTSQLQYEIDVPLCEMVDKVNKADAVKAYSYSLQSISDIEDVFKTTGVDAGFKRVSSVFLASDKKGLKLIKQEYEMRREVNLPVSFLDEQELKDTHNIKALGALKNNEAAQIDCYRSATGLLQYHKRKHDLKIYSHTDIVEHKETSQGYELLTDRGYTIQCKYLVIATGFESGKFLPEKVMNLNSTYAIVSEPVAEDKLWPECSLIWETAEPYFYMRTTSDNRMMIGGEDEPFKDEERRDKLLREKIKKLEKQFRKLYPEIPFKTDMAWCGTFSSTEDGLPYIGAWPGKPNMFFALGYGGNGITFSMIAAQVIKNKIKGIPDEREDIFGFER